MSYKLCLMFQIS